MGVEAVLAIAGALVPPVANFVNKKWLKKDSDTTEATANTLATTSPEILPSYLQSMSGWYDTLIRYFNRDVIGTPRQWVIDLRAAIRPAAVVLSVLIIAIDAPLSLGLTPETRGAMLANISSWFSSRLPG